MTATLKPGDMVRPMWSKWATSNPSPIALQKRPPGWGGEVKPDDLMDLEDLFENKNVAVLKWTEVGLVLAATGDYLMVLFGEKFGWAPAKDFETLPE